MGEGSAADPRGDVGRDCSKIELGGGDVESLAQCVWNRQACPH